MTYLVNIFASIITFKPFSNSSTTVSYHFTLVGRILNDFEQINISTYFGKKFDLTKKENFF